MKHALIVAALVIAGAAPCRAQKPGSHEAEFHTFYANFRAAVPANNPEKIADLIAFPVDDWSTERNGNVQTGTIKDRADFLARYNSLFTASMRSHILRANLKALKDGTYELVWRNVDVEFSFEFYYIDVTGYRVRSYNIGPL
jgi:hypothetical protein